MKEKIEAILESSTNKYKQDLYIIKFDNFIKIGRSSNIENRVNNFILEFCSSNNTINIGYYKLIKSNFDVYKFKGKGDIELLLHNLLKDYRYNFENKFGGYTECYPINIFDNFIKYKNKKIKVNLVEYTNNILINFDKTVDGFNFTKYKKYELEKYYSDKGIYKLGNYYFDSKSYITKFNRVLLTDLHIGKVIDTDIIEFVLDLYSHHPNFQKIVYDNYISIDTKIAEYNILNNNYNKYNVFCINYINENNEYCTKEFSSSKCIANINI